MPTYQYACTEPSCEHRFELVQSFSDSAVTECPVCSGRVRKVYGSVGVVFKGSGFYRTDSRTGDGAKAGSDSGKSEAKAESKSDNKSESKSESKSEPKSSNSSTKSESSSTSSSSSAKPAKAAS